MVTIAPLRCTPFASVAAKPMQRILQRSRFRARYIWRKSHHLKAEVRIELYTKLTSVLSARNGGTCMQLCPSFRPHQEKLAALKGQLQHRQSFERAPHVIAFVLVAPNVSCTPFQTKLQVPTFGLQKSSCPVDVPISCVLFSPAYAKRVMQFLPFVVFQ